MKKQGTIINYRLPCFCVAQRIPCSIQCHQFNDNKKDKPRIFVYICFYIISITLFYYYYLNVIIIMCSLILFFVLFISDLGGRKYGDSNS